MSLITVVVAYNPYSSWFDQPFTSRFTDFLLVKAQLAKSQFLPSKPPLLLFVYPHSWKEYGP